MERKFGFDLLALCALEDVQSEIEWHIKDAKGDSEIEKLLFAAMDLKIKYGATDYTTFREPKNEEEFLWLCSNCVEPFLWILARRQVQLEGCRVDFVFSVFDIDSGERGENPMDVLSGASRKWKHLVVECDGHDYHERTKQQAARDRSRDRKATLAGTNFFRFTGSELWRDPYGCAEEIIDWATNITYPSAPIT